MEEKNWLQAMQSQTQLKKVMETNQYTEKYGLALSEEDAQLLVTARSNSLREQKRVEFGNSILSSIIYEFCDSAYIEQKNYVETLTNLQDIFFLYKNEMMDEITDEELLHFMKEQFETVCFGDLGYLESTCLDIFAQAIRAGYRGYHQSDGIGEFAQFDIAPRWDRALFDETLRDLCEG